MGKCVAYKFANAILWTVVGTLFGVSGVVFMKLAISNWKKYKEKGWLSGYDITSLWQAMVGGCFLVVCIIMIVHNVEMIMTCKIFPEKVVLDMITQYMKG